MLIWERKVETTLCAMNSLPRNQFCFTWIGCPLNYSLWTPAPSLKFSIYILFASLHVIFSFINPCSLQNGPTNVVDLTKHLKHRLFIGYQIKPKPFASCAVQKVITCFLLGNKKNFLTQLKGVFLGWSVFILSRQVNLQMAWMFPLETCGNFIVNISLGHFLWRQRNRYLRSDFDGLPLRNK